jgi:hypothetical protein
VYQQSVNNCQHCNYYILRTMLLHLPIIEVLPTYMGNMLSIDAATPTNERQQTINRGSTDHQLSFTIVSTEHPRFSLLHFVYSECYCTTFTHNRSIISKNSSLSQHYHGDADGHERSDRTLYALRVNQLRPFAQVTGNIAYLPCCSPYTMSHILATHHIVY